MISFQWRTAPAAGGTAHDVDAELAAAVDVDGLVGPLSGAETDRGGTPSVGAQDRAAAGPGGVEKHVVHGHVERPGQLARVEEAQGHQIRPRLCRASRAAICWASFLERPRPRPMVWPVTLTSTLKTFS